MKNEKKGEHTRDLIARGAQWTALFEFCLSERTPYHTDQCVFSHFLDGADASLYIISRWPFTDFDAFSDDYGFSLKVYAYMYERVVSSDTIATRCIQGEERRRKEGGNEHANTTLHGLLCQAGRRRYMPKCQLVAVCANQHNR